jgi:putative acetyltransferase
MTPQSTPLLAANDVRTVEAANFDSMDGLQLRLATHEDCDAIRHLFRTTIQKVNIRDYDADQVAVWSAGAEDRQRWLDRIDRQYFLLAEQAGELAGIASLEPGGYFDVLYVHHGRQGQGLARGLADAIEAEARRQGCREITSDVSITARPFFERRGYVVLAEQRVERQGVQLTNFKVRKPLD